MSGRRTSGVLTVNSPMMIDESSGSDERLDETTEMKIRVPVRYQLALHELKVVTGKQISSAVTEAVEMYFRDLDVMVMPDEGEAEPAEAG